MFQQQRNSIAKVFEIDSSIDLLLCNGLKRFLLEPKRSYEKSRLKFQYRNIRLLKEKMTIIIASLRKQMFFHQSNELTAITNLCNDNVNCQQVIS